MTVDSLVCHSILDVASVRSANPVIDDSLGWASVSKSLWASCRRGVVMARVVLFAGLVAAESSSDLVDL